jgi:hypothetical protein
MSLHLVAFAVNCVSEEDAEVEFAIASQDLEGNWVDWQGRTLVPFWTWKINGDLLDLMGAIEIPQGWIEHIHEIARKSVSKHKAPEISLADRLGITPAKTEIRRRV